MTAARVDWRVPPAVKKAIAAKLVDHFGVSIDAYAKLTDRQIQDLYFHKRTKEGEIEMEMEDAATATVTPPQDATTEEKPPTLENELLALDMLAAVVRMNPADVARAKEQLRAKYAAMESD